jgi:hypothetical protein
MDDGVCCDDCNVNKVIPARMEKYFKDWFSYGIILFGVTASLGENITKSVRPWAVFVDNIFKKYLLQKHLKKRL